MKKWPLLFLFLLALFAAILFGIVAQDSWGAATLDDVVQAINLSSQNQVNVLMGAMAEMTMYLSSSPNSDGFYAPALTWGASPIPGDPGVYSVFKRDARPPSCGYGDPMGGVSLFAEGTGTWTGGYSSLVSSAFTETAIGRSVFKESESASGKIGGQSVFVSASGKSYLRTMAEAMQEDKDGASTANTGLSNSTAQESAINSGAATRNMTEASDVFTRGASRSEPIESTVEFAAHDVAFNVGGLAYSQPVPAFSIGSPLKTLEPYGGMCKTVLVLGFLFLFVPHWFRLVTNWEGVQPQ